MPKRDVQIAKARAMFNSIGICGDAHTLGRLVGFADDMLDYYYRIRVTSGPHSDERKEACWSAVGWFIPLRETIPADAYAFLEHVFCLNGCPPADEFIITETSREENIAMYGLRTVELYEQETNNLILKALVEDTTISSCGTTITIRCGSHDTKDDLLNFLTGAVVSSAKE